MGVRSSTETYVLNNLFQIFWHCLRSSITSRRRLDKAWLFSSMLCQGKNSFFRMLRYSEVTLSCQSNRDGS